jgi:hypothetical protein
MASGSPIHDRDSDQSDGVESIVTVDEWATAWE